MIILHGGMKDGWMLLWGEQSPEELGPEGNGDPVGNEHPYCAGPEELVNVLADVAPGFEVDLGETVSATAWLLSRGSSPLPSSALVADPPRSRAKHPGRCRGPYRHTECLRRRPSPYCRPAGDRGC